MSFGFEAPPRLRLGAVPWPEATALTAGLENHPDHDFRLASPEELLADLQERRLDAALLPPIAAWQAESLRLVPGIALVLPAEGSPPPSVGWPDSTAGNVLDLSASASLPDLQAAWKAAEPELPLVLLVWVCRARAPYPLIRRSLVAAMRASDLPPQGPFFHHGLGSEESDGLRALLRRAKAAGIVSSEADLFYC